LRPPSLAGAEDWFLPVEHAEHHIARFYFQLAAHAGAEMKPDAGTGVREIGQFYYLAKEAT
jgi:hypothetical protein